MRRELDDACTMLVDVWNLLGLAVHAYYEPLLMPIKHDTGGDRIGSLPTLFRIRDEIAAG